MHHWSNCVQSVEDEFVDGSRSLKSKSNSRIIHKFSQKQLLQSSTHPLPTPTRNSIHKSAQINTNLFVEICDDLWTNHTPCYQPHASFFAPNADVLVSIEMLLSLLGDWEAWRSGEHIHKTLLTSESPKLQGAKAISQPFSFYPRPQLDHLLSS